MTGNGDAAILHIAAEQPGQHHADLRLALAAAALNDHHALPLVAGDQAIADKLLHCGNVLRVKLLIGIPSFHWRYGKTMFSF